MCPPGSLVDGIGVQKADVKVSHTRQHRRAHICRVSQRAELACAAGS